MRTFRSVAVVLLTLARTCQAGPRSLIKDRHRKLVGTLGTIILCTIGLVLGGPSVGLASPTLQFTGDILTGVTGVDVGGTLYDVQFMDGTCVALFNGCDQNSDFVFSTVTGAHAASVALIDALVSFQTPEKVAGCNYEYICALNTPYGDFFLSNGQSYVKTWQADLLSSCCQHFDVPSNGMPVDFDLHYDSEDTITWAVWTAAPAEPPESVPEPSSFLLLVSGLVGIAGCSWRRRCQAGGQVG